MGLKYIFLGLKDDRYVRAFERCILDVWYWLWWIFDEIICFLAKGNQPYSVKINRCFLSYFYRLRLIRNLNGNDFIVRSGKS